jgi:hypothetical protein
MDSPPSLFKYLSPEKLVFFEDRMVLLTPPVFLNDPWDFLPAGRLASDEEIRKACQQIESEEAKASIIHLPADFAQRRYVERLQQLRNWGRSKEFSEGLVKYSKDRFSSTHGIVSLSEKPLCRLMWAHYAASHTGFVAEFATQDRFEFEGQVFCGCINTPAGKVDYPTSFKLRPWTSDNIANACWSKHPDWKYESEWRILWPLAEPSVCQKSLPESGGTRSCLRFAATDLVRVIFGMGIKAGVKQRLCNMLNQDDFKHVRKEETEIDSDTGKLTLKSLS